jgi:hypothetical protein
MDFAAGIDDRSRMDGHQFVIDNVLSASRLADCEVTSCT